MVDGLPLLRGPTFGVYPSANYYCTILAIRRSVAIPPFCPLSLVKTKRRRVFES